MLNRLVIDMVVATAILSYTTIAVANDDVLSYLDGIIGNINSNEIMHVRSEDDLSKDEKIFKGVGGCQTEGSVYKCFIGNPEHNVNIVADFTFDDYERESVIVRSNIQMIFLGDEELSLPELERIKSKLLSSGMVVTDTTNKYAVLEGDKKPDRRYNFEDNTNLVSGEIRVPAIMEGGTYTNTLSIAFKYGIPNAVKRIESTQEIKYDEHTAIITKQHIDSVTTKMPSTINVKITHANHKPYIDSVIIEPDCNINIHNERTRIVKLDERHNALTITYACGSGNRANTEEMLLYVHSTANTISKYKLVANKVSIKQIDNSMINYILSENLISHTGANGAEVTLFPTIYNYSNGIIKNVTRQHPDYLNVRATENLNRYNEDKNTGTLYNYLLLKHLSGASKDAWKKLDTVYKSKDKANLKKILRKDIDNDIRRFDSLKELKCSGDYCEFEI